MNLLRGRIGQRGDRNVARFAGGDLGLPRRAASMLGRYIGSEVIVGIRPEDLYESAAAGDSTQFEYLPVRVDAVEPLGAETLLMVTLDGSDTEMIARIGRDTALRRGERVRLALDTAAIHLFDPATTKAIA